MGQETDMSPGERALPEEGLPRELMPSSGKELSDIARRMDSLTRNLLECYEELDLIYRLSRGLMSQLDPQNNVALILGEAMEIFDADMGWVIPADSLAPAFGTVTDRVELETVNGINRALVAKLLEDGRSKIFYDLSGDLGWSHPSLPESFLCAVIKTEESVYGALCVGRSPGRDIFTAGDLKLSNVLATQAAIALENALLHRKRLEEEQAMIRLQEEFRLARSIQENLLPKELPRLEGYDISGRTLPAQSVGGDYYDVISMDPGHVALCLGDVSGKGMPAALLMAHLQAAIRGQTLLKATPGLCLGRSNTLLYQSTDTDRFATCFYGILDAGSNSIRYANAGHDHPLLLNREGEFTSLEKGGIVLGILEGVSYPEASVELSPGDVLVVYSDGITDAADDGEDPFGVGRLSEVVRAHRDDSASELVDRVMDAVETHAGDTPQTDDMTLVVIRRDG